MRRLSIQLLVALAAAFAGPAQATIYYVSPTGNDANNGTSQATAWRTIARVNQVLPNNVNTGDQVLFQRGGHFRGEIICGAYGSAAFPLVLGAYGSGDAPIIDGSVLVSGWTQHQGNIWKAYVGQKVDQVYVGGVRMTVARMPNSGWYRNDQASVLSMHSADLTQPNGFWTGTRCVVRNTASSVDTIPVVGFNNGTLTFSMAPMNQYMGVDDWGFYLDNRLDLLDTQREWYYESSSGYLYFQAPNNADPNSLQIEASVSWTGIWIYPGREYISIQNLSFRHQRNAGVRIDDGGHVVINGCTFQDLYHGIRSYGHYNQYTNNTFSHTLASGCFMIDNNSLFEGNVLTDIAVELGQGESMWGYFGVRSAGAANIIRGNTFDRIGYIAIVADDDQVVEKNIIRHHLVVLNDGGAIAFDNTDGLTVQDNIIYDPICGLDGSSTVMPHYQRLGVGIYFGNTSNKNVVVQRNTIANLPGVGIVVDHTMVSHGFQVKNNTIFNCDIGLSISDYSNAVGANATPPYYVANYNDVYSGNVIYGLTKDQLALRFYHCYSALPTDFGTYTNNRYFNPYNEMCIFLFSFQAGQTYWALDQWQAEKGEEAGSTWSPLHLSGLGTVNELSSEMVPGGSFPNNVNGWGGWPTNAQVTHNTTHLDDGCLKAYLPDNTIYDTFGMFSPDWFSVAPGDWYRLDVSLKSDEPGQLQLSVKGQSQANNPYAHYTQLLPFSAVRRDVSLYFQVPEADQAQLRFVNDWNHPMYYLDNVSLHKVQVEELDPLDKQILLINEQNTAQTFTLTGCWSDVEGMTYTGSITLPAFRSKVLVREDDGLCLNTSSEGAATVVGPPAPLVYPNPVESGGMITFTTAIGGMVAIFSANGQEVHQERLPNGTTGIVLPEGLPAGVYSLRLTDGSGRTERLIIQ